MIDVDTVFGYTLDIDVESALFVYNGGHIIDEVFCADSVDIVKHHPACVLWFDVGYCVSLPGMMLSLRV